MRGFKDSGFFKLSSRRKFSLLKKKIIQNAPWVEVRHIGGTAIPGALTKGDVDLLVRLNKNKFSKTKMIFEEIFEENNRELWNDDFAIFKDTLLFSEKIDILVVTIGSKSDLRHRATELLQNNKSLLKKYNQMKAGFLDVESEEYKIAKRRFYDKLEQVLIENSKRIN